MAQSVPLEAQANVSAEAAMVRVFERYREARAAVLQAIDSVNDPQRRENIREFFKKNEEAWEQLIDHETFLTYRWARGAAKPNIKYRRVVEAERASERIVQFERIASAITAEERANKAPEPTPTSVTPPAAQESRRP